MKASIAEKQHRRDTVVYRDLLHLLHIVEYMRNTQHPDFDYRDVFKQIREILK